MTVAATESLATLLRRIATNNVGGSDRDLPRRASHIVIEAADRLDELSAALSKGNAWVPVSERLPDPIDSYVIVSGVDPKLYGRREMHVCALDDDDHGFTGPASEWRWMTEAGRVISEVTHWMPLPSAPEAK